MFSPNSFSITVLSTALLPDALSPGWLPLPRESGKDGDWNLVGALSVARKRGRRCLWTELTWVMGYSWGIATKRHLLCPELFPVALPTEVSVLSGERDQRESV